MELKSRLFHSLITDSIALSLGPSLKVSTVFNNFEQELIEHLLWALTTR